MRLDLPVSAVVDACHLSVWHRAATENDVAWLRDALGQIVSTHGTAAVLIVIPEGTPLSSANARARAVELIRDLGPHLRSVAVVIEGDGFWKAAVRAMFTGIAFLARPPMPWQIFESSGDAIEWLNHASSAVLDAELEKLRAAA